MKQIDASYTGGREMCVNDFYELTDRDRAQIRLRELREEKFLRDCEELSGAKTVIYETLKGILMLAATALFCLVAIIWQKPIMDFFRNLLN